MTLLLCQTGKGDHLPGATACSLLSLILQVIIILVLRLLARIIIDSTCMSHDLRGDLIVYLFPLHVRFDTDHVGLTENLGIVGFGAIIPRHLTLYNSTLKYSGYLILREGALFGYSANVFCSLFDPFIPLGV